MTSPAHMPELSTLELLQRDFALWSRTYDHSPNPLLSLEERFLFPLLPKRSALDAIDVGCGTGRWLERLAANGTGKLIGVDSSPEMLDCARRKLGHTAEFFLSDATSLPVANRSADILLASFVASYIADLDKTATELRRVARADAQLYISDLHPETAVVCNWKRAFRTDGKLVELQTYSRSLPEIISCFSRAGFKLMCVLEPPFGPQEQGALRRAGKPEAFDAAAGLPAIFILQLGIARHDRSTVAYSSEAGPNICLAGARVSLTADTSIVADLEVKSGHVASIATSHHPATSCDSRSNLSIDLSEYLLLPGLINSHDHLEFGLYPNLGLGSYANFEEWSIDIQRNDKSIIDLHQRVPKPVRFLWGGIRNLLCGVTTVCHHNPLQAELLAEDFPVRVVKRFGWAHSLVMDNEFAAKARATPSDVPFVVHAAEGVGETASQEIFQLEQLGALDDRTVLVHGLALTDEGIALLNRRNSSLVWCPTSNRFLFGRTHDRETLASIQNVLIGSDSPLTSAGDLLDEVRLAHEEIGVSAEDMYRMLLTNPASALRLMDGQGTIRPMAVADMIAIRDTGGSPAEMLANMQTADVELVIVGGQVRLASETIFRKLPCALTSGLEPLDVDGRLCWIRAPLAHLFRETEGILGCDIRLGKKRIRHVCTA